MNTLGHKCVTFSQSPCTLAKRRSWVRHTILWRLTELAIASG
jgi:hypothetical protein